MTAIRHIGTAGIKPRQCDRDEGKRLFPNDAGKARAYALIAAPMGTIAGVKPRCLHPVTPILSATYPPDQSAFDALDPHQQADVIRATAGAK